MLPHILRSRLGCCQNAPAGALSAYLTPLYAPILIRSAHALIDSFLSLEPSVHDSLPHVAFGRVCYACLVLVRLGVLMGSSNAGGSEIEDPDRELRLSEYLGKVSRVFEKGGQQRECLGKLFATLKGWWSQRRTKGACGGEDGMCVGQEQCSMAERIGTPAMLPSTSSTRGMSMATTPRFTPVNNPAASPASRNATTYQLQSQMTPPSSDCNSNILPPPQLPPSPYPTTDPTQSDAWPSPFSFPININTLADFNDLSLNWLALVNLGGTGEYAGNFMGGGNGAMGDAGRGTGFGFDSAFNVEWGSGAGSGGGVGAGGARG